VVIVLPLLADRPAGAVCHALELTLRIGQSELLGDAIAQDVVDPAGPESRRPRLQIAGLASRLVEGETMTVLLS
jgi:hypothetical protein